MALLNRFIGFLRNGADTFKLAASGQFREKSKEIQRIEEELFGRESSPADDKVNLHNDRKKVEGDMRRAFDKIE